jgi:hypothetical protein
MDDLIRRGLAMLAVEEVPERGVGLQLHRRRALRKDVGARIAQLERGLAQRSVRTPRSTRDTCLPNT